MFEGVGVEAGGTERAGVQAERTQLRTGGKNRPHAEVHVGKRVSRIPTATVTHQDKVIPYIKRTITQHSNIITRREQAKHIFELNTVQTTKEHNFPKITNYYIPGAPIKVDAE